jgi:hypothetical protein
MSPCHCGKFPPSYRKSGKPGQSPRGRGPGETPGLARKALSRKRFAYGPGEALNSGVQRHAGNLFFFLEEEMFGSEFSRAETRWKQHWVLIEQV